MLAYVHTSAGVITCPDMWTAIAVAHGLIGGVGDVEVYATTNTPTMPNLSAMADDA